MLRVRNQGPAEVLCDMTIESQSHVVPVEEVGALKNARGCSDDDVWRRRTHISTLRCQYLPSALEYTQILTVCPPGGYEQGTNCRH